jgi:hypothetical protein
MASRRVPSVVALENQGRAVLSLVLSMAGSGIGIEAGAGNTLVGAIVSYVCLYLLLAQIGQIPESGG